MIEFGQSLDLLSTRSFGGIDVAVDPTSTSVSSEFFGSGPLPCGVEEAVQWFLDGVNGFEESVRMLFLVGGPGNGKSFVANQVSTKLIQNEALNPKISHREYRYRSQSDSEVIVVNDASIVDPEAHPSPNSPLVQNVLRAIESSSHLMVNVNRGVLYRELPENRISSFGQTVLEWVANPRVQVGTQGEHHSSWNSDSSEVLHFAKVREANTSSDVLIVAVHLDGYSLLERRPRLRLSESAGGGPELLEGYAIQKFSDRTIEFTRSTPAGALFGSFFQNFPIPENSLHPFAANVTNLKNPEIQRGVLTLMRSAEIMTNRRFSYRDIWGLIATGVLGQNEVRGSHRPSSWAPQPISERDSIAEQINSIQLNGSMRFHQALVGAIPRSLKQQTVRQITSSQAVEAIRRVDPAIDARVGGVTPIRAEVPGDESIWAKKFLESLSGTLESESFLESILTTLTPDERFRNSLTEFEWDLDRHVCRILHPESNAKDVERRQLLGWYGEYLIRLFAFSLGYPAFYEEISEWIAAWRSTSATHTLTRNISQGLKSLLLPTYQGLPGSSSVLLPVFSSKTEPLIERTVNKVVALEVSGAVTFESSVEADELFATLVVSGENVVKLAIDFSLMREILNCTADSSGASEESITSVPRIERIRSAMLVSGSTSARAFIVDGLMVDEVTVGGVK